MQALKNGQIDGIVVDLPTAFYVTAVQVPDGTIVGQFPSGASKEGFGLVFAKGNPLVAVREQGDRPALGKRDDQDAPAHLAREGDRCAGAEVAAGHEPPLPDPRRRDRPLLREPGGRDRRYQHGRRRRRDRARGHALARLARVQGVLLRLGRATATPSPRSAARFLLNVKIFSIAEAIILVTALALAVIRSLPGPVFFPLRALAIVYADFFRGVPTILIILMLGSGMPALQVGWIPKSQVFWAIVSLVLVYTAYVSEVYRAGIESVHPSQEAAARSLGLTRGQALRYVILPQAVRRVVPPLLNDFIGLQKDTALVSVLGVVEALQQSQIDEAARSTAPTTSSPRRCSSR